MDPLSRRRFLQAAALLAARRCESLAATRGRSAERVQMLPSRGAPVPG